ncbi:DNA polymerase III subunit delta [bacterium K02(2017)]|nr:DNA polymerase III subunit delta [bacterium K02(2017)]
MANSKAVLQFVLNGEEFLTRRHVKKLIKQLAPIETRDFNYDRVSAKDQSVESIVGMAQTLPMMADNRMVVVEDFESYLSAKKASNHLNALVDYLANPNPQTHLLMIGSKLDKRTSFYKKFIKVGEVKEFKSLYANQVPEFIENEAKSMGLELAPGCSNLLAEIIGTDLMSVISELEKLQIYVMPQNQIGLKQINELVSSGLVENVFAITNLIGQKKYFELIKLYKKMTEQGEPVIKTVALITNHFRKLFKVNALVVNKGVRDNKQIASLVGIHPFFVKDYMQQLRFFKGDALRGVYKKLMQLSVQIRSNGPTVESSFESFLQDVCVS